MENFSKSRARHLHPIGGEVTGEIAAAAILEETNRYLRTENYSQAKYGWDGCIDAPNLLPAGSMLNLSPRTFDCGTYWEGAIVSRNISRDSL